jgi:hypothetical protein
MTCTKIHYERVFPSFTPKQKKSKKNFFLARLKMGVRRGERMGFLVFSPIVDVSIHRENGLFVAETEVPF